MGIEVTKRTRLADGYFARYQSKDDGSIVTLRIDEGQWPDEPKGVVLPKGTWIWLLSWKGAVFDTPNGLLDTAGDFYPGDAEIDAVYIPQAGIAQCIAKTDADLTGSTLTLKGAAVTDAKYFEIAK